jgi:hypothetical protein
MEDGIENMSKILSIRMPHGIEIFDVEMNIPLRHSEDFLDPGHKLIGRRQAGMIGMEDENLLVFPHRSERYIDHGQAPATLDEQND